MEAQYKPKFLIDITQDHRLREKERELERERERERIKGELLIEEEALAMVKRQRDALEGKLRELERERIKGEPLI